MLAQDSGRTCGLWREAHIGAGFQVVTEACWGLTLEQSIPDGLYNTGTTHVGAVLGDLQSTGRTHAGVVSEGLYPMRRTSCWSCAGLFWKGL